MKVLAYVLVRSFAVKHIMKFTAFDPLQQMQAVLPSTQPLQPGFTPLCCLYVLKVVESELQRVPPHVARRYSKQLWSVMYIPQVTVCLDRMLCC